MANSNETKEKIQRYLQERYRDRERNQVKLSDSEELMLLEMVEQREAITAPKKALEALIVMLLILYPECLKKGMRLIDRDDLTNGTTVKDIFLVIHEMYMSGYPVNPETVLIQLKSKHSNISSIDYLLNPIRAAFPIGSTINLTKLCLNLKEKNMEIRARDIVEQMFFKSRMPRANQDIFEFVEEYQKMFDEAIKIKASDMVDMGKAAIEVLKEFEGNKSNNTSSGVRVGIEMLDYLTGGFQPGNLIIVAGRPGMGKTAFVIAIIAAMKKKMRKLGFFSLEMNKREIIKRLCSYDMAINLQAITAGKLSHEDEATFLKYLNEFQFGNVFISDSPDQDISEIEVKSKQLVEEQGCELLMLDYIQIVKNSSMKGETRNDYVGDIAKRTKGIARKNDVPVIALAQISRIGKKMLEKKKTIRDMIPALEDLRESGDLENAADMVIFLLRPAYYENEMKIDDYDKGKIYLVCAKFRNGSVFEIKLDWIKEYAKIVNPEDVDERVIEYNQQFEQNSEQTFVAPF